MSENWELNRFKVFAINQFGTGQHPEANESTLTYFSDHYIKECAKRAYDSGTLNEAALKLATEVLNG